MTFFYVEIKKEKKLFPYNPFYKKRNSSLLFTLSLCQKEKLKRKREGQKDKKTKRKRIDFLL